MLKIRQEQLDVLNKYVEDQYKERLQTYLRTEYAPEAAPMSEDELKQLVDTGVQKALTYDISSKRDVADYLVLLLRHGVDFERQPQHAWALDILKSEEMDGETKILELETTFDKLQGQS